MLLSYYMIYMDLSYKNRIHYTLRKCSQCNPSVNQNNHQHYPWVVLFEDNLRTKNCPLMSNCLVRYLLGYNLSSKASSYFFISSMFVFDYRCRCFTRLLQTYLKLETNQLTVLFRFEVSKQFINIRNIFSIEI